VALETDVAVEPPPAVQVAVLRIVTESVSNAVQHSGGTRCRIRVSSTESAVSFTVSDDGRGISATRHGGVGLRSMRERAAEMGAALTVRDEPAGGVLVSATIPVPQEAP
jgi:signal transduction histidine kinase